MNPRTDFPAETEDPLNGHRYYVEGVTFDKKNGTIFDWQGWRRTLELALLIPENTEDRKISLLGIWDSELEQWLNFDSPEAL